MAANEHHHVHYQNNNYHQTPNGHNYGHGHGQNYNGNHAAMAKKRQSHILQPAHIRLPGKFEPGKKYQSQPAPMRIVNWGDDDQAEEFAVDIINNMGRTNEAGAGVTAGTHFDHHNNADGDSIISSNHSHSASNHSSNSLHAAKFRPSAQQKLLANGYGKNSQGNFFNITKRKSMGDHKKKLKRRMSRSRTFVSNTNGKRYNVFEQNGMDKKMEMQNYLSLVMLMKRNCINRSMHRQKNHHQTYQTMQVVVLLNQHHIILSIHQKIMFCVK